MNKLLESLYYNPENPASFSSVKKLWKASNSKDASISINDVQNWLSKQNAYTLHKQRRRRFKREKIVAERQNEQFQADLVDMQAFKSKNNNFNYILTCIDVFSKFAYAIPIKTKSAQDVSKGFEKIFKSSIPQKIQTDKGKEFLNTLVQSLFKRNKIIHFVSHNEEIKCSIVERFNRTIKSKMWKFFTANGTRKWLSVLQQLVDGYNNSIHRSTGFKPINVGEENKNIIFEKLYGYSTFRDYLKSVLSNGNLNVNDQVRIPHKLTIMDKSYYPLWKDKVYQIKKVIKGKYKPLYKVSIDDEEVEKRFYPEEVQKINDPEYRIEKILKSRKRNNKKEYYIKWLGYPSKFNTWEPAENIRRLNRH